MQQEDDLRALESIVQFTRGLGVFFLVLNAYWFCYEWWADCVLTHAIADRILLNIQQATGLFSLRLSVSRPGLLRHKERPQRQSFAAAYRLGRMHRLPAVLPQ